MAQLGDLQLNFARPGVPAPRPVAVAMRRAVLGALAALGPDQLGDLGLHELLRDGANRLADHVDVLIAQHLLDDLLDRHSVRTGHLPASFRRSVRTPTSRSAAVAGTCFSGPSDPLLHQH